MIQWIIKWIEERGSAAALRERLALEQERRAFSEEKLALKHAQEIAELKKEPDAHNVSVKYDRPDLKAKSTDLQEIASDDIDRLLSHDGLTSWQRLLKNTGKGDKDNS